MIYIYTYMTFLEFAGVSCSSGSPTRRLFVGIKKSKGDLDLDHGMIIYSFSFQRLYDHLWFIIHDSETLTNQTNQFLKQRCFKRTSDWSTRIFARLTSRAQRSSSETELGRSLFSQLLFPGLHRQKRPKTCLFDTWRRVPLDAEEYGPFACLFWTKNGFKN
jgi:hypothetical protein